MQLSDKEVRAGTACSIIPKRPDRIDGFMDEGESESTNHYYDFVPAKGLSDGLRGTTRTDFSLLSSSLAHNLRPVGHEHLSFWIFLIFTKIYLEGKR